MARITDEMAILRQLFSDLRTGKPKLNLPQVKIREASKKWEQSATSVRHAVGRNLHPESPLHLWPV